MAVVVVVDLVDDHKSSRARQSFECAPNLIFLVDMLPTQTVGTLMKGPIRALNYITAAA